MIPAVKKSRYCVIHALSLIHISVALIMYETKKRRAKGKAGQMLQLAQSEEGEN